MRQNDNEKEKTRGSIEIRDKTGKGEKSIKMRKSEKDGVGEEFDENRNYFFGRWANNCGRHWSICRSPKKITAGKERGVLMWICGGTIWG